MKNWVQLKHGDLVSIWDGKVDPKECVRLRFQCYFGASRTPRTPEEPVVLLPEGNETAELETITARRDQEILEERRLSLENGNPPVALDASAVIVGQPEVRTPAPSSHALDTGKAGIDKRVARLRVESGVSKNLRQTFDGPGSSSKDAPSNKSLQSASANHAVPNAASADGHAFAVQPSAVNRRDDQLKGKPEKSSGSSTTANLKRQMYGKNRSTGSLNTKPLAPGPRQPVRPVRSRGPGQPVSATRSNAPGQNEKQSFPASEATTEHA